MGNIADLNVSIGGDVKPLQAALDQGKASLANFANVGATAFNPLNTSLSQTARQSLTAANDIKSLTATLRLLGTEQSKVSATNIEGFTAYQRAIDETKIKINQLKVAEFSEAAATEKVTASNIETAASSIALGGSLQTLRAGFSAVRQAAYLLPGIGMAGIFNLAFEGITQAVSALGLFTSDADKAAAAETNLTQVTRTLITENEKFSNQLKETVESISDESTKVNEIFSALSSSNASLGQRKSLINELIQLSPAYFGNLDKEKASYDEIAKAVDAYNTNLGKSTVIKSLLPNFERIVQPLIAARAELFKQQSGLGLFGVSDEEMKAEEDRLKGEVSKQEKLVAQAQKGFETIAGGALDLQEILFGKADAGGKTAKSIQTVADILAELQKKLQLISGEQEVFGGNLDPDRIKAIETAIKGLLAIGVNPGDSLIAKLSTQADDLQAKLDKLRAGADLFALKGGGDKLVNPIKQKNPVIVITDIENPKKYLERATQESEIAIEKMRKSLQAAVSNVFENIFESIGQSLGDAISGKGNPFEALGRVLGDGIKAIGAQLIKFGVAAEAVKLALKNPFAAANPFLLIAGGVALEAIGSAISNLGITPHADGGIFTKPTLIGSHLFGEKGPEALVPLSRMSEFGAGDSNSHIEVTGSMQWSYNGIRVMFERADKYTQRNYGNFNGK